MVDQLFPNENPVGETIRIRNLPFQIVGVLAAKGFNLFGQDQDDIVIVPYTSHMHRITTRTFVNSIQVQAANDKVISLVQQEITDLLLARHHSKEQDFTVRSQLELMQTVTATSRAMGFLLAGVAAVSLVVGGIGIMNIMLVSVTERTREIGIRMAVGARAADILVQFLIEAVTLERDWRRDWHCRRRRLFPTRRLLQRHADRYARVLDYHRGGFQRGHRHRLRFLSRVESVQARPD